MRLKNGGWQFYKMAFIDFRFNKKKLIPDIREYGKVLLSTVLVVYFFKVILFAIFPSLETLSAPWDLVVIVFFIFYFKNIFDIKFGGTDYF